MKRGFCGVAAADVSADDSVREILAAGSTLAIGAAFDENASSSEPKQRIANPNRETLCMKRALCI